MARLTCAPTAADRLKTVEPTADLSRHEGVESREGVQELVVQRGATQQCGHREILAGARPMDPK